MSDGTIGWDMFTLKFHFGGQYNEWPTGPGTATATLRIGDFVMFKYNSDYSDAQINTKSASNRKLLLPASITNKFKYQQ
jgi:hypothetical protein